MNELQRVVNTFISNDNNLNIIIYELEDGSYVKTNINVIPIDSKHINIHETYNAENDSYVLTAQYNSNLCYCEKCQHTRNK